MSPTSSAERARRSRGRRSPRPAGEHAPVGDGVGEALEAVADRARPAARRRRRRDLEAGDRRRALDGGLRRARAQRRARVAGLDPHVPRLGAQRGVVDHAVVGRLHRERGDERDHHHRQRADGQRRAGAARERVLDAEAGGGGEMQRGGDPGGARRRRRTATARPSASASTVFRRPARSAGSAAKSATAATISASAREQRARAGRRSASASPAGSTSASAAAARSRCRRPGRAGPAASASATYSATSSATTPRGVMPDRLQQADLAPLGEHAAADHGRDGEADGDQRQQRVDADDDRVGARLVGDRVADVVPVGEAAAAQRGSARWAATVKRVGGLGVGEPDADARPVPCRRAA